MIQEIKYTTYSADATDYNCPDGELAAVANLLNEDGAMKPLAQPKELFALPEGTLKVFVHESASFENESKRHYIFLSESNDVANNLAWVDADDTATPGFTITGVQGNVTDIATIGNVLTVNTDMGVQYLIWRNGAYAYLGARPSDIVARVELTKAFRRTVYGDVDEGSDDDFDFEKYRKITDISDYMPASFFNRPLQEEDEREKLDKLEHYSELCNIILSSINTLESKHKEKGYFYYPFLIRLAWRMYDGTSLMCHTPPILVNPCGTGRPRIRVTNVNDARKLYIMVDAAKVSLKINAPVGEWSDLIQSLDVFVTPQAQGYSEDNESFTHLRKGGSLEDMEECQMSLRQARDYNGQIYAVCSDTECVIIPKRVDDKEAYDVIENESRFYLLKSIPVEQLTPSTGQDSVTIDIKPTKHEFDTLTTKEVMTDSQDSRRSVIASDMYNYNSRLNISIDSVVRSNPQIMPLIGIGSAGSVTGVFVEVNAGDTTKLIDTDYVSGSCSTSDVTWFFTDNPDAVAVWFIGVNFHYRLLLRKHATLSGMFAFYRFMDMSEGMNETIEPPQEGDITPSFSTNEVIQSEVNNPFFFPLTNTVSVGVGKVMAMKAAVKAMSTSQFGEYPVYVFSTDGVWTLSFGSDGIFTATRLVTPDVCINALSVTQIDSAVIFATARGLMMISGSTATCISDSLSSSKSFDVTELPNGDRLVSVSGVEGNVVEYGSFNDFVSDCRIAYDYVRQRIIVYNPTLDGLGERKYAYAYVYSLKSKQWGIIGTNIDDTVLAYGDALMTTQDGMLVSGEDANKDGVNGMLVTRPLKLGLPDTLKTIRKIIQRGVFDKAHVKSVLYGSRDLIHWQLISSSTNHIIEHVSGTPYKYFRICILTQLTQTESIYGCTVEYEPKQQNKLR